MSQEQSNQELIQVKVSDVKAMLLAGKTRQDIGEHYGLTLDEVKKQIFCHPELKFKKTRKAPKVALIDDTVHIEVVNDSALDVAVTEEVGASLAQDSDAVVTIYEPEATAETEQPAEEISTTVETVTEEVQETTDSPEPAKEEETVAPAPETSAGTW